MQWKRWLVFVALLSVVAVTWGSGETYEVSTRRLTRSARVSASYFSDILKPTHSKQEINQYCNAKEVWLSQYDLTLIPTLADGSCIFDALAKQLPADAPGAPFTAIALRDCFLKELRKIKKIVSSPVDEILQSEADIRRRDFLPHFPGDIDNTLEELKLARLWGNPQVLTPLAAFILRRPVIHICVSSEEPYYSVQAVDECGKALKPGKWLTLRSQKPLYLVFDGYGHYEGATSSIMIDADSDKGVTLTPFSTVPAPSVEATTPDVSLHPSEAMEYECEPCADHDNGVVQPVLMNVDSMQGFQHNASVFAAPAVPDGSVKDDTVESVEPDDVTFEGVMLTAADPFAWIPDCCSVACSGCQLGAWLERWQLKPGLSGKAAFGGGFMGALVAAFHRLEIPTLLWCETKQECLHDLAFLQATRSLLDKLSSEPLLASEFNKSLSFYSAEAPYLEQVQCDLNRLTDKVWAQPLLMTVLACIYNQPILLLHPMASSSPGLLFRPWHAAEQVADQQIREVLQQYMPAALVHNGGEGAQACWREVLYEHAAVKKKACLPV